MPHLTVIPGTPPPDTPKQRALDRVKRAPKPAAILQCPRCGCREVLELTTGASLKNGKLSGGVKAIVCAGCYMKGERVVLA